MCANAFETPLIICAHSFFALKSVPSNPCVFLVFRVFLDQKYGFLSTKLPKNNNDAPLWVKLMIHFIEVWGFIQCFNGFKTKN